MSTKQQTTNKEQQTKNTEHPLFDNIHQLLLRHTGIDRIVDHVVSKLGGLHQAYLCGSFARGVDSPVIELLLIGKGINQEYLQELTAKAEQMIDRQIRYHFATPQEADEMLESCPEALLLYDGRKEAE